MVSLRVIAIIFTLLIGCFAVVHGQRYARRCSRYEDYKKCAKPVRCQPSCENRKGSVSCSSYCSPGCVCKGRLVRDSRSLCIHPRKCPIRATPYPTSG